MAELAQRTRRPGVDLKVRWERAIRRELVGPELNIRSCALGMGFSLSGWIPVPTVLLVEELEEEGCGGLSVDL